MREWRHASNSASIPTATAGSTGTGVAGVPIASDDHAPAPSPFTAATRTVYLVPLVRPVMSCAVARLAASRVVGSQPSSPDRHCTL